MVSTLLFKLELWDGLMAPSLGMTMEQTGLSSSERTFICSSSIFFICFMIWINFHHKTGRVGRRPTELPFFSFMAEWEKERGQWFQRALVGSQLSHWTAMLPFHIHAFSSDQNSRIVPWGRWKLHGLQEDRGWRKVLRMKYICLWSSLMTCPNQLPMRGERKTSAM